MGRMRFVAAVSSALILLLLGACGGGDGEASDDADAATSSADSAGVEDASDANATESGDTGSTDSGGDFPIPSPDGIILDALEAAGIGMDGQRQLYYPDDDFDRIVAFYDDWTEGDGEWTRAEAEGTVVYQSTSGGGIRQITVSPDQDPGAQAEGPATFVVLVAG